MFPKRLFILGEVGANIACALGRLFRDTAEKNIQIYATVMVKTNQRVDMAWSSAKRLVECKYSKSCIVDVHLLV